MSERAEVWSRYRDNTARHLMGIARDLQHRTLHHLTAVCDYQGLRPSFGPLLSLVAMESRPLGALAAQLSISPQACSQLVNVGEAAGYVERRPAPADRRTRLVGLTDRGRALVADAAGILLEIEADYRRLVGADSYAKLIRHLGELFHVHGLGISSPEEAGVSAGSMESIGVLPLISVQIQRTLMEATSNRGHVGLKMSHAQVLPLIGIDGARVHQLARLQRMSRQAISATARDLEGLGYLRREADPLDRRGVVFCLTEKGTGLIEDSVAALDELDQVFTRVMGAPGLLELQRIARRLYQALHLEEEIFEARSHSVAENQAERQAENQAASDSVATRREPDLAELALALKRQLGVRGAERLALLLEAGNSNDESYAKETHP